MRRGEVTQNDRVPYAKVENGRTTIRRNCLGECRAAVVSVVLYTGDVGIADRSGSDLVWLAVV